MGGVDEVDERPAAVPLVVSVLEDGTGHVSTLGGRSVYHVFELSPEATRRRIEQQLAVLGPTTRAMSATELDLRALPAAPDDIDVDHGGRWIAVGGSTDDTGDTGTGWCATGDGGPIVELSTEGRLTLHAIGKEVLVVESARNRVVRTLHADGTLRHAFEVSGYPMMSTATDAYLVLFLGPLLGGRLVAYRPTGEMVFDFDRDMTVPAGRNAVLITSGPPAEDLVDLSHVAGAEVAWRGDWDDGVINVLDLDARHSRTVLMPELFDHAGLLAVTPDGAVVARVVDEELWTWRPPGPIVRTRVPPHRGARALHGGRVAIWDDRRALVIDPPPPDH